MVKRVVMVAAIVALAAFPATALEFNIGLGADFGGDFEVDALDDLDRDGDAETGFTAGVELMQDITDAWEIGGGAEYLFPRGFDDSQTDSETEYWTLYAGTRLQLFGDELPIYLAGRYGWSDLSVDEVEDLGGVSNFDEEGGEYWAIGGGLDFADRFKAELLYSNFTGDIETDLGDSSFDYDTISVRLYYTFGN